MREPKRESGIKKEKGRRFLILAGERFLPLSITLPHRSLPFSVPLTPCGYNQTRGLCNNNSLTTIDAHTDTRRTLALAQMGKILKNCQNKRPDIFRMSKARYTIHTIYHIMGRALENSPCS